MRITYKNRKIYLSLMNEEFEKLEKGKPLELNASWLKVIQEDISKCVLEHWSLYEVHDAIEELPCGKRTSKNRK